MKKVFSILLLTVSVIVFSQNDIRKYCGTPDFMKEVLKDSEKKQILNQLELFTKDFIKTQKMDGPYVFPVVVHVIHNYGEENISYEQIDNGIVRINEDFNALNDDLSEVINEFTTIIGNTNFEFRLATKDPDGNCTYGVTRTASNLSIGGSPTQLQDLISWDDMKYINIWVVRGFEEGSGAAAFAYKPGTGPNMDGIFCLYNYFGDWNTNSDNGPTGNNWKRHTMPHTMGHFFNLDHPWGASNSPGEYGNCSMDDGVEDTPPTLGTDGNAGGCPLDQATCGSLDNVQNIMDYSSCAHMFTQGQSERMIAAANSLIGNRWYLWQEDNLVATGTDDDMFNNNPYADCVPIPDFTFYSNLNCMETTIEFTNFTYNYRDAEVTYSWNFEGGTPSFTSIENPSVTYNNPGTYDVSLTACVGGNCNTTIQENAITIISQMNVSSPEGLSQGFEDSNFPDMESEIWFIGDDYNEQHWERTELASDEGIASFRINSQNYGYNRNPHVFITPELNLSEFNTSSSDPFMVCFDIAYARRLPENVVDMTDAGSQENFSIHNDVLIISSKSCGEQSWFERPWITTRPGQEGSFQSQQQNLFTTTEIYPNSFVPNSDEWEQRCITIQQLAGDDDAIIKFEFRGTGEDQSNLYWVAAGCNGADFVQVNDIGGNWLYLDNLRIGNSSAIQNATVGCTDSSACNYNSDPDIIDNTTCQYPQQYYDCYGTCIVDTDCDSFCDEIDNCAWIPNPDQLDSDSDGLGDECDSTPLSINESLNNKYLVKVIDILGRENSKQGLQIELYDDGSVKKKYLIK